MKEPSGRHLKWPYLAGKPPFFKKKRKSGEKPSDLWFFENSVKTSGFYQILRFFSKSAEMSDFSPLFWFFIKKTEKVVVFHLNMAIFGALNRIFTLNLEVTSELARRSKIGHIAGGQDVTSRT